MLNPPTQVNLDLLYMMKPYHFSQDDQEDNWLNSMNEELDNIEKTHTWELVSWPTNKNVISMKWVFGNKLNGHGEVVINKVMLVCKCYAQIEGLYFDEFFSLVAQLEAMCMFLGFSSFKKFNIYHMDVKFAFLNGELHE